jgi:hypothetical protein
MTAPPYSEHETAQAIVYWLGGMRQRDIARRMKGQKGPSQVCVAIGEFVYSYGGAHDVNERKTIAVYALERWCRMQDEKPRFRLATQKEPATGMGGQKDDKTPSGDTILASPHRIVQ